MKPHTSGTLHLAAAVLSAAVLWSCSADDAAKTLNSQEEAISKYISGTLQDYRVTRREGSNRVTVDEGYGADTLAFGDSLSFYYAGYVFSGGPSTLFATNVQSVAKKNNFNVTSLPDTYDECEVLYDEGCFVHGLVWGLNGVRSGEHAIILFSAGYGFYDTSVANVPAMSALCYEIWVDEIKKN